MLTTDGTLDQETVTLVETEPGLFRGMIATRATAGGASVGDGVLDLDATGGEQIVASHVDGHAGSSASLATLPESPARSALFVVGNIVLGAGDQAVHDHLVADGWSVLPIDDGASSAGDAAGHDLVLISSTVQSNQVGTKFRDVAVPVLAWEPYVLDDLGMTGTTSGLDYGSELSMTDVVIRDPSHPLSAGFDGVVTVTTAAGKLTYGRPGAGAVGVARVGSRPERLSTLAHEVGDTMAGYVAPARRVSTFLSDTTAATLTADGWALVDAAVCWAVHCDGQPVARFTTAISGPNGRVVDFDASASTAYDGATLVDFEWSFGDGGTADGSTPRRVYPSADYRDDHGFWVSLTVTDSLGRTATTARPLWLDGWRQREALFVARSELLDASDATIAERLRLRGVRATSIGHSAVTAGDAAGQDLDPAVGHGPIEPSRADLQERGGARRRLGDAPLRRHGDDRGRRLRPRSRPAGRRHRRSLASDRRVRRQRPGRARSHRRDRLGPGAVDRHGHRHVTDRREPRGDLLLRRLRATRRRATQSRAPGRRLVG